jgi:hypothetical protein
LEEARIAEEMRITEEQIIENEARIAEAELQIEI